MADLPSVPLTQAQPFDMSKGINAAQGVLGLQQQRQALQTGQYTQATAQADSEQAQQKNSELQAVGNLTKNAFSSGRYKDQDGNFDNQKFASDVAMVAPTYGQQIANSATARAGELYQNQQTLLNLTNTQRQTIGSALGALATKPDVHHSDVVDALDQLREQIPGKQASRLIQSMGGGIDPSLDGPTLQAQLRKMALMTNAPNASESAPNVSQFQGKGGMVPVNTNPQAPGGVGQIPGSLPAQGVAPQLGTSTGGQASVISNQGVSVLPQAGPATTKANTGPRTATDDAPPANAPRAVQDAYMTATKNANEHVESVRSADENYGNNKAISTAVRRLASDATTGPGTETWNHAMGILGTKGADNYQELGAFLDRQASTIRGQMGLPGTNAGAEDAKMIAGNTKYNAKVIQDKNDYTEALTEGLHQYRNGLDRVAGFSGQASPAQIAKFKSAWTDNFDPNILIGENAYKRSKAEGDRFMAGLDPKEAASLAAKRRAMKDLAAGKMQ